jgi:hypothetical protein
LYILIYKRFLDRRQEDKRFKSHIQSNVSIFE